MIDFELATTMAIATGVVIQILKTLIPGFPKKYIPVVVYIVSFIMSSAVFGPASTKAVFYGLIVGAIASGGYSQIKAVIDKQQSV